MKRIEPLASLVDKDAYVLDIGTDHAYLPIYLYKNNITKSIVGSDISKNALEYAKTNLVKYGLENKIKLFKNDTILDILIIIILVLVMLYSFNINVFDVIGG